MLSPKSEPAVAALDMSPFPLSLSLVKAHLREDSADFDTIITLYRSAAIEWAEGVMKRTIYNRAHTWVLADFERGGVGEMRLPRGLSSAVDRITYAPADGGAAVTIYGPSSGVSPTGDDWTENLSGDGGGLLYPGAAGWPEVDLYAAKPVEIAFHAGWASAAVPADITHALLFAIADQYDTASSADLTVFGKNLTTRTSLISPYILNRWYQ